MPEEEKLPAFYALRSGGWRDYITILHLPYTLWHLSYVALGAAVSSVIHWERVGYALLAFGLGLGIGAHALDEYRGRPLRTRIPGCVLLGMGIASLAGAVVVGIYGVFKVSPTLLPFIAFGAFTAAAYTLEWWGGLFHTDVWFALSWGAFPVLTAHWANVLRVEPAGFLMALAAYSISRAQRRLSTPVRTLRRRVRQVEGRIEYIDGSAEPLDESILRIPLEGALRALSWAMPLVAAAALLTRAGL